MWVGEQVGCSLTRLLTRTLVAGARVTFADPTLACLSVGPCQTPTLAFVVHRHREILAFVPRQFWQVRLGFRI